ncbi:ComEC/Rec2 family competence protein [Patescibacteria group bacterium]|nr:ComEC/Rec2 family competence protein [Patescibacteria group bacterium]
MPSDKQSNFHTSILITQPIYIEDNRYLISSDSYNVKAFSIPSNLTMGDVISVEGDRYFNTIFAKKIQFQKKHFLYPLFSLKSAFVTSTNQYFLEPYASLINGMIYGTNPNVSPAFKDQLISAGVIHTIVVSGYNISLIFTFVLSLLRGLNKKLLVVVCSFLACFYAIMVGFEPPVIRALIFGIAIFYAKSFGYVRNSLYILFVTSFLMLIFSPGLLYSVSFLLTFFASFGIIFLSPKLQILIDKTPLKSINFISESIASTISAQIFVFPILAHFFTGINLISIVCNPIVLWVIPYIMIFGFIFSLFNLLNLEILLEPIKFTVLGPTMFFTDTVAFFSNIKLNISTEIFKNWFYVFGVYIFYSIIYVYCRFLTYNFIKEGTAHKKSNLKFLKILVKNEKIL